MINKLIKDKNNSVRKIGFTVYNMIKKMKEDDAFSIGVIPGLKSIILNKYLVPIEKKENVYSYTKEINNYMKELKDKETKDNNEKNIVEQKNKNDLDYQLIKKSIINEIKDINMDQDDYINFINSNYCDNDLNKNSGDLMNYNKYFIGNTNLKKEDLKPGEITQLDIIFNKYIKE